MTCKLTWLRRGSDGLRRVCLCWGGGLSGYAALTRPASYLFRMLGRRGEEARHGEVEPVQVGAGGQAQGVEDVHGAGWRRRDAGLLGVGSWRGLAPSRKPASLGSAQRDPTSLRGARGWVGLDGVGLRCANPTTLCLLSFPAFRV